MSPCLRSMNGDEVYPELIGGIEKIKNYRIAHGASLEQAKNEVYRDGALRRYRQITGYPENNPQNIWHHRLSKFGPPCSTCGKPLRTPRAKLCAECGAPYPAAT
jgi:hypothetical protein